LFPVKANACLMLQPYEELYTFSGHGGVDYYVYYNMTHQKYLRSLNRLCRCLKFRRVNGTRRIRNFWSNGVLINSSAIIWNITGKVMPKPLNETEEQPSFYSLSPPMTVDWGEDELLPNQARAKNIDWKFAAYLYLFTLFVL
jgi:hypothetical protein